MAICKADPIAVVRLRKFDHSSHEDTPPANGIWLSILDSTHQICRAQWPHSNGTKFRGQSAPQQKNDNDDYQYRPEPPTIIMVRSAHIKTTTAKKENQNDQEQD
jgi:hypothetical protein